MKVFLRALASALTVLVPASLAWAQLSTAQLSGRITDESGATLPGVTVTVTQTDTGLMRTAVTNDTGTYVLPNLPTGPYRLEAALQGFRTFVQTGIVLQVAATPVVIATALAGPQGAHEMFGMIVKMTAAAGKRATSSFAEMGRMSGRAGTAKKMARASVKKAARRVGTYIAFSCR